MIDSTPSSLAGGHGLKMNSVKSMVPPVPRIWGPGRKSRATDSASTWAVANLAHGLSTPIRSLCNRGKVGPTAITTEGEEMELPRLLITDALAFHTLRRYSN